jgi:N,N'-diacetyllegionaminate synthase
MVYIIAESGVDHEGSMDRAMKLLNSAVDAKADCFKIQYYEKGFRGKHRELPWLPTYGVQELRRECKRQKIDFLITPHDEWALDFIIKDESFDTIKIGSGDWHLLEAAKDTGKNLIVSCGGKDIASLDWAGGLMDTKDKYLHCVSEYPCPPNHADLKWMVENRMEGYSDHTRGTAVALAAVALGAEIIEKHITLERDITSHNDTFCSLLPNEWYKFIRDIRSIELAIA